MKKYLIIPLLLFIIALLIPVSVQADSVTTTFTVANSSSYYAELSVTGPGGNANWDNDLRDASTATDSISLGCQVLIQNSSSSPYHCNHLRRSDIWIDTSSLPANAVVYRATLTLGAVTVYQTYYSPYNTALIAVFLNTDGSATINANSFNQAECGNLISSEQQVNDGDTSTVIDLNPAAINKTGYTKLAIREYICDYLDTTPKNGINNIEQVNFTEGLPYLTISYYTPSTSDIPTQAVTNPVTTITTATSSGSNSVVLLGNISSIGDALEVSAGFRITENSNLTGWVYNISKNMGGPGNFTSYITNIQPGLLYCQAVVFGDNVGLSSIVTVIVTGINLTANVWCPAPVPVIYGLQTRSPTNIQDTTAVLNGSLLSSEAGTNPSFPVWIGYEWGEDSTISNHPFYLFVSTATSNLTVIPGLELLSLANSYTYYYKTVACGQAFQISSDEESFTTGATGQPGTTGTSSGPGQGNVKVPVVGLSFNWSSTTGHWLILLIVFIIIIVLALFTGSKLKNRNAGIIIIAGGFILEFGAGIFLTWISPWFLLLAGVPVAIIVINTIRGRR